MAELFPDFRDLLVELHDAGVRFLIVGGFAVGLHGFPRATKDLDIWVDRASDNAARVMRALMAYGAPLQQLGIQQADFEAEDRVVHFGVPPVRIDMLTHVPGVVFGTAFARAEPLVVEGRDIPVLGREDLLAAKRAAGRPKDLIDIDAIENAE